MKRRKTLRESASQTGAETSITSSALPSAANRGVFVPSLWQWLIGVGATGGVALHLMGRIAYSNYVSAWGVDRGLFPQASDETVVFGYYAFVDRSMTLFSAMSGHGWALAALFLLVALYVFLLIRIGKIERAKPNSKEIALRQQSWQRDLIESFLGTAAAFVGVPLLFLVAIALLIVPAALGENFGRDLAAQHKAQFAKGCATTASDQKPCVTLRKDGALAAYGHVILSSQTHIALYDLVEGGVRAMGREGMVLMVCDGTECLSENDEASLAWRTANERATAGRSDEE